MRIVSTVVLALATFSAAASAADRQRPIGKETTIPFAAHHGLRDWEAGPTRGLFYVQDYRRDWYRVRLSGPCIGNMASLSVAYTTSPTGAFDRFSQVFSTDFPHMTCSVLSIQTSLPPPERQKRAKSKTDKS
ncbi:MAG TPA: hypothetical protein VFT56_17635 [Sphingomonas sp.]|nr:hypothetical protein [Sphingomonas sp.]